MLRLRISLGARAARLAPVLYTTLLAALFTPVQADAQGTTTCASQVIAVVPGSPDFGYGLMPPITCDGVAVAGLDSTCLLGQRDYLMCSLGELGKLTLHFDRPIANGPGNDLIVYGSCNGPRETAEVLASEDGETFVSLGVFNQPWSMGFDLAGSGLATAAYVRIQDLPGGVYPEGSGVDIDAICALNTVDRQPPDLVATTTPGGWTAPLVPRGDATATAVSCGASQEIPGDTATTFINYAIGVYADSIGGPWRYAISVDGTPALSCLSSDLSIFASHTLGSLNQGPIAVAGGWHTLRGVVDADAVVSEIDETNNATEGQWLWRPHELARNSPTQRAAPPAVGTLANPNCDALRVSRDPRYAWVIAVGGMTAGDDYDVFAYDDYLGSQSGLSHLIGSSVTGGAATEFVAGTFWGTPDKVYPTIRRSEVLGGGQAYVIDYEDARGHTSDTDIGGWSNVVLSSGRVADVFEVYFAAGVPRNLALLRSSGSADIAFEVMGGVAGGVYGRGASGAEGMSVPYNASLDTLRYRPTQTGWHPIVVYRTTQELADSVTYSLQVQEQGVLGVRGPDVPRELRLGRPYPNPTADGVTCSLFLPTAQLADVSVFDIGGRLVQRLSAGSLEAGENRLVWNARDSGGNHVAPGMYIVRARVGAWGDSRPVFVR